MFCNDNFFNQFEEDFELKMSHNYTLTEINEMLPWEREVYINMIKKRLDEINKDAK